MMCMNKSNAPLKYCDVDKESVVGRFWEKVDIRGDDECWPWIATKVSKGYGVLNIYQYPRYAHRLAWMYANKADEPVGKVVMHSCDNPACCNPGHLSVGTVGDNSRDMVRKNRGWTPSLRGENHPMVKLTEKQVIDIRSALDSGSTTAELAGKYGVSVSHIRVIKRREAWRHI